jgi:hypothetical protein
MLRALRSQCFKLKTDELLSNFAYNFNSRRYMKAGVIFCSLGEAVKEYPELVRKHLGSVVRRCKLTTRMETVSKAHGTQRLEAEISRTAFKLCLPSQLAPLLRGARG